MNDLRPTLTNHRPSDRELDALARASLTAARARRAGRRRRQNVTAVAVPAGVFVALAFVERFLL